MIFMLNSTVWNPHWTNFVGKQGVDIWGQMENTAGSIWHNGTVERQGKAEDEGFGFEHMTIKDI